MGSGDDRRDLQPNSPSRTSLRLSDLTRVAHEHLQRGDLHKAMEHFEAAVERSKTVEDIKVKISCYLNAGACLVSLGKYTRGLSFLESASSIIKTMGEENGSGVNDTWEMSADVFYNIAVAAQGLQDYDKAVSSFKSCIDLYMKADSKEHAAEAFTSLASCHRESHQNEREIACLSSAQHLYNDLGDCSNEALVCIDLAKAYLGIDRPDECKQMLSTAKMMCLRMDDPKIQGKLHTRFGLVYTSLRMFDEAIQSFERALPLVRIGGKTTAASLQMEASVLQNIGAVYNEKGLFSEGVIYHREAAALHGKTKNYNSEAKCLCNLAFAHTQLKDYRSAAESFSSALTKAQSARNPYMQFQACEGLGAANYHLDQCSEAITYFNLALEVLDEIKQDTGIARERVMEKLSDATEALQQKESRRGTPSPKPSDSDASPRLRDGSTHSLDRIGKEPPRLLPKRHHHHHQSPEMNGTTGTQLNVENLPLPGKRGLLPPIDPSRSPQLTARVNHDASMSSSQNEDSRKPISRKHAKPSRRTGKNQSLPRISEGPLVKQVDSYEDHLQAYMNSYPNSGGNSSSSESSLSGGSQDGGSSDVLGASIFSRQAMKRHSHKHRASPPKLTPPSPPLLSQGVSPPAAPLVVQEGSLAIGPNARELFTTRTHMVPQGQKRRRHRNPKLQTQIVPKTVVASGSGSRTPASQSPVVEHHQSKVCLLL